MPQVRKPQVRQALVDAAKELLAGAGYDGTTLAAIAARAGTSIGNLYKYFADKEELFAAAIPAELVQQVGDFLRRRFESAGSARDVESLAADHPHRAATEAFLAFAIEHRRELVFLLSRAEGTAYASFRRDLVADAVEYAVEYATRAYPGVDLSAPRRRTLLRIYSGYFASVAAILEHEKSRRALREAVTELSTYHLAGLRAFLEALPQPCSEGP